MIYLLLAEGFEETEALTVLDILRRGGLDACTVGITGKRVKGAHGITVEADLLPKSCTAAPELLILPGGMPGTANLDASPEVDRLLSLTLSSGGRIGAICAAPSILGRRGLLRGCEAVCYPGFEQQLLGAVIATKSVVTSGAYTTAIGMGAAFAFALELLSLLRGPELADEVARTAHIPR